MPASRKWCELQGVSSEDAKILNDLHSRYISQVKKVSHAFESQIANDDSFQSWSRWIAEAKDHGASDIRVNADEVHDSLRRKPIPLRETSACEISSEKRLCGHDLSEDTQRNIRPRTSSSPSARTSADVRQDSGSVSGTNDNVEVCDSKAGVKAKIPPPPPPPRRRNSSCVSRKSSAAVCQVSAPVSLSVGEADASSYCTDGASSAQVDAFFPIAAPDTECKRKPGISSSRSAHNSASAHQNSVMKVKKGEGQSSQLPTVESQQIEADDELQPTLAADMLVPQADFFHKNQLIKLKHTKVAELQLLRSPSYEVLRSKPVHESLISTADLSSTQILGALLAHANDSSGSQFDATSSQDDASSSQEDAAVLRALPSKNVTPPPPPPPGRCHSSSVSQNSAADAGHVSVGVSPSVDEADASSHSVGGGSGTQVNASFPRASNVKRGTHGNVQICNERTVFDAKTPRPPPPPGVEPSNSAKSSNDSWHSKKRKASEADASWKSNADEWNVNTKRSRSHKSSSCWRATPYGLSSSSSRNRTPPSYQDRRFESDRRIRWFICDRCHTRVHYKNQSIPFYGNFLYDKHPPVEYEDSWNLKFKEKAWKLGSWDATWFCVDCLTAHHGCTKQHTMQIHIGNFSKRRAEEKAYWESRSG